MKVAISITSTSPDALPDPRFGRAAAFLFVDTDTGECQVLANDAAASAGGAGVQTAEIIVRHGAQAVISGSFGPKAYQVLTLAGVRMYRAGAGTTGDLLRDFQAGLLAIQEPG